MSDIYLLVPVHNRAHVTKRFADLLCLQTNPAFHLILLDDGSSDGTADAVRGILGSKATVVTGRGDWWWGGALQVGYELIKSGRVQCKDSDIIGIMNDDSIFTADFFERVHKAFDLCSGSICLLAAAASKSTQRCYLGASVQWFPFRVRPTNNAQCLDCAPTRALFMKSADFKVSGGFWPTRIPHYFADYEFTFRIKRQGLRFVCPQGLTIEFSKAESGALSLYGGKVQDRLRKLLSEKCDYNPIPWSWFILRHARPRVLIPLSLLQIWLRAFIRVLLPGLLISAVSAESQLQMSNRSL